MESKWMSVKDSLPRGKDNRSIKRNKGNQAMTHEAFLEWIDKEIENEASACKDPKFGAYLRQQSGPRHDMLIEVREKFLTLTPPPTTLS